MKFLCYIFISVGILTLIAFIVGSENEGRPLAESVPIHHGGFAATQTREVPFVKLPTPGVNDPIPLEIISKPAHACPADELQSRVDSFEHLLDEKQAEVNRLVSENERLRFLLRCEEVGETMTLFMELPGAERFLEQHGAREFVELTVGDFPGLRFRDVFEVEQLFDLAQNVWPMTGESTYVGTIRFLGYERLISQIAADEVSDLKAIYAYETGAVLPDS